MSNILTSYTTIIRHIDSCKNMDQMGVCSNQIKNFVMLFRERDDVYYWEAHLDAAYMTKKAALVPTTEIKPVDECESVHPYKQHPNGSDGH